MIRPSDDRTFMKTPPKNTNDELRALMQQHTAATFAKPAMTLARAAPTTARAETLPPRPAPASATAEPTVLSSVSRVRPNDRCTVRLTPAELEKLDRLILWAHMNLGARLTLSDVLRIGLSRVGEDAPPASHEVEKIRSHDARRLRPSQGTY